jgi:hypothetical protein
MRHLLRLVVFAAGPILSAQTSAPEASTLAALRDEVHQLRLAIERSTLLNARTQIAIERIQTQESRVNQAAQKLGEVRQELARSQAEKDQLAMEKKATEDALTHIADNDMRRNLELRIRDLSRRLENTAGESDIRAREGEMLSHLQTEQGTLTQVQSEMNQLAGALDRAIQQITGAGQQ